MILEIGGETKLKFALAYGFRNIQNIVQKIKRGKLTYHFVEVMACPAGKPSKYFKFYLSHFSDQGYNKGVSWSVIKCNFFCHKSWRQKRHSAVKTQPQSSHGRS